jgi:hypothetical protein
METQDFENKLSQMKKPEVSNLEHQAILAEAIIKAKDKLVLSSWWLSIPMYIIAAFIMKSIYMPQTTLLISLHEFAAKQKLLAILLFIVVPILFIILNFISIRNTYKISGSLKYAWLNLLIILFSILLLLIFTL